MEIGKKFKVTIVQNNKRKRGYHVDNLKQKIDRDEFLEFKIPKKQRLSVESLKKYSS